METGQTNNRLPRTGSAVSGRWRVLQSGTFEKVGGEKTIQVDTRVISVTNKDLRQEVASGRFREDLFCRLSVMPITMPPLRERTLDIPLLAEHFLAIEAERTGLEMVSLSPDVLARYGRKQPRTKVRKRKLTEAAVAGAMEEAGGNKVAAARLLGVSRATLYRFLEETGL